MKNIRRFAKLVIVAELLLCLLVTPSSAYLAPVPVLAPVLNGTANIALRGATGSLLGSLVPACGTGILCPLAVAIGVTGVAYLLLNGKVEVPVNTGVTGTQVPLTQNSVGDYAIGPNHGASPADVCQKAIANLNANPNLCQASPPVFDQFSFVSATSSVCTYLITHPAPCTAAPSQATFGISASTTTETRTSPNSTQAMKVCGPGGWCPDTSDPDTSTMPSFPATGAPISITGTDSYKNPTSIVVLPTPDGGTSVTVRTQVPDSTGATKVQDVTMQLGPTGQVVNQTTTTYNNTYINPQGNPVQITPQTAPGVDPTAGQQQITFPDDYPDSAQHTLTQQTNAKVDATNTKLDTIHHDLTDSATPPNDPTSRTAGEISDAFFPDTFTALKGWTVPARSVSCPTGTFSLWSHVFTIDAHCTLWATVAPTVQAIMLLIWTLLALFIVLSA